LCHHLLLWFCSNEEGDGNYCHHLLLCVWEEKDDSNALLSSFLVFLQRKWQQVAFTFFVLFEKKKKTMAMCHCLFV
jgi:hypothetical protein